MTVAHSIEDLMRVILSGLLEGAGYRVALAASAAPAGAHVQISPTRAAPDDSVLFELLVPNERPQATTQVQVKVPAGVLVYSFEETPGWRRTEAKAADGSVGVITWPGDEYPWIV